MSQQKVVLITGASAGIGEAAALEFAKLSYKIAFTGRNQDRMKNVLKQLMDSTASRSSADFLPITADFEKPEEIEPIIDLVIKTFGRLDILVNNAGYPGKKRNLGEPDFFEDFKNIMQVNLFSATRLAHLATPHLLKTKGVIVNVSSIADRMALPNVSYSVSKAALTMLTKSLANAFDGTGVRCVTVAPGPIVTNFAEGIEKFGVMTSLQRSGTAKEVADTIVFLCSDKASYIHGCTVDVDGGCAAKFGGIFPHEPLIGQKKE